MGKYETTVLNVCKGRYKVKREFDLDGTIEETEIVCNNPAYGSAKLDEWQMALLESKRPKPQSEAA